MKFLIVALAFVACVNADVSELGYGYQQPAAPVEAEHSYLPPAPAPVNTYVPPASAPEPVEPINSYVPPASAPEPVAPINSYVPPAPVSAPVNTYVPPVSAPEPAVPVNTYVPPAPAPAVPAPEQPIAPLEEIEQIPEDGYHYKTVRRVVYRHRA